MAHEVISAFLDNEPFDANELGAALAEPSGRELLMDLMALRAVVTEDGDHMTLPHRATPARTRAWWIVPAAAVLLAAAGGFAVGSTRSMGSDTAASKVAPAPTPTQVLKLEPGVNWEEKLSNGGE